MSTNLVGPSTSNFNQPFFWETENRQLAQTVAIATTVIVTVLVIHKIYQRVGSMNANRQEIHEPFDNALEESVEYSTSPFHSDEIDTGWVKTCSKVYEYLKPGTYLPIDSPDCDSYDGNYVGLDGFAIEPIETAKLYTKEIGSCFGLLARGYDKDQNLTHMGLAHIFLNPKRVPFEFLKEMRNTVGENGTIDLLIAGGKYKEDHSKIYAAAKIYQANIIDDISPNHLQNLSWFDQKNSILFSGLLGGIPYLWHTTNGVAKVYFDAMVHGKELSELIKKTQSRGNTSWQLGSF